MERTGYHPLISASFAQCRNRRPQTRSVVFSNGGFLHSVPAGSFFCRFPATPKNTPVKRNFFTIAIHCKHGCFNNETNTTHAIRQKSADNGCTPIATDPDKTALSNHRVSLNPAVLSLFRSSPARRHFQNRPLTKNRQPEYVFNGSRGTFLFRRSPARRHFQNRPLTKNRQPKHVFNGSRRRFSLSLRIRPLARQTNTHQDKRSTPPASFPGKSDKENPSLPGGGFRPLHGRKPSSSFL